MDTLAGQKRRRARERARDGLGSLLKAYPEGVPTLAAVDRLVEDGLPEREAMELVEEMRASGQLALQRGRWKLK